MVHKIYLIEGAKITYILRYTKYSKLFSTTASSIILLPLRKHPKMSQRYLYVDENSALNETLTKTTASLIGNGMMYACNQLKAANAFLAENKVDVIIIDPNFSNDNGFAFIEKRLDDYLFIIHSARTKDAVRGYDLGIFDFLPKPFGLDRFKVTYKRLNNQNYIKEKQKNILPRPYLEVRCDLMTERILHENIQYIEAMGDYAKIVTPERKYVVLMSMKKLEEVLPYDSFFRVHKSYIVNVDVIRQFSAREIIVAGIKIPLSRFKKQRFFSFMQSA